MSNAISDDLKRWYGPRIVIFSAAKNFTQCLHHFGAIVFSSESSTVRIEKGTRNTWQLATRRRAERAEEGAEIQKLCGEICTPGKLRKRGPEEDNASPTERESTLWVSRYRYCVLSIFTVCGSWRHTHAFQRVKSYAQAEVLFQQGP